MEGDLAAACFFYLLYISLISSHLASLSLSLSLSLPINEAQGFGLVSRKRERMSRGGREFVRPQETKGRVYSRTV